MILDLTEEEGQFLHDILEIHGRVDVMRISRILPILKKIQKVKVKRFSDDYEKINSVLEQIKK